MSQVSPVRSRADVGGEVQAPSPHQPTEDDEETTMSKNETLPVFTLGETALDGMELG